MPAGRAPTIDRPAASASSVDRALLLEVIAPGARVSSTFSVVPTASRVTVLAYSRTSPGTILKLAMLGIAMASPEAVPFQGLTVHAGVPEVPSVRSPDEIDWPLASTSDESFQ